VRAKKMAMKERKAVSLPAGYRRKKQQERERFTV